MKLLIASLAERPDLARIFDAFPDSWPEFMYHDPVSELLFDRLVAAHPESNVIAVNPEDPSRPVARACAFPFRWAGDPDVDLPPGGYDRVLLGAAADAGAPHGLIAAAVEVTVRPESRGTGVSGAMLAGLRRVLAGLGYQSLVVPVRPNHKHLHPDESMATYLGRARADLLPADPWLRTHVRAGARIVGEAAWSMTVTGRLSDWRQWTGLPFDRSGPVIVPEALVPVRCDVEHDIATYVEPNVWVHHRLAVPASH